MRKLYQTGIVQRFDIIVVSEEVGASKPTPDIFLNACCRAATKTQQCTYVGDNLQNDTLAAEAVGMKGVWLNRAALSYPQIAVLEIKNLGELVAVI